MIRLSTTKKNDNQGSVSPRKQVLKILGDEGKIQFRNRTEELDDFIRALNDQRISLDRAGDVRTAFEARRRNSGGCESDSHAKKRSARFWLQARGEESKVVVTHVSARDAKRPGPSVGDLRALFAGDPIFDGKSHNYMIAFARFASARRQICDTSSLRACHEAFSRLRYQANRRDRAKQTRHAHLVAAIERRDKRLVSRLIAEGHDPSQIRYDYRQMSDEACESLQREAVSLSTVKGDEASAELALNQFVQNALLDNLLHTSKDMSPSERSIGLNAFTAAIEKELPFDFIEALARGRTHEPQGDTLNAVDGRGETALTMAIERSDRKLARLLLDLGAGIEATDCYGRTPLMRAVRAGDAEMVALLIEKGANIFARNQEHCVLSLAFLTNDPKSAGDLFDHLCIAVESKRGDMIERINSERLQGESEALGSVQTALSAISKLMDIRGVLMPRAKECLDAYLALCQKNLNAIDTFFLVCPRFMKGVDRESAYQTREIAIKRLPKAFEKLLYLRSKSGADLANDLRDLSASAIKLRQAAKANSNIRSKNIFYDQSGDKLFMRVFESKRIISNLRAYPEGNMRSWNMCFKEEKERYLKIKPGGVVFDEIEKKIFASEEANKDKQKYEELSAL